MTPGLVDDGGGKEDEEFGFCFADFVAVAVVFFGWRVLEVEVEVEEVAC